MASTEAGCPHCGQITNVTVPDHGGLEAVDANPDLRGDAVSDAACKECGRKFSVIAYYN